MELYRKGIQCVDDVWDSEQRNFLNWDRVKQKFSLTATYEEDWTMLVDKISAKWRSRLEDDEDTTYQREWVGFYVDGGEDPALVLQCQVDYTPTCMQLHHLSLSIPVQCFTVGTHSRCLREWEKPEGGMIGIFHKAKIIQTHIRPKREGEHEQITFFDGKLATLGWDPDRWRWSDGGRFLDYTTKEGGR